MILRIGSAEDTHESAPVEASLNLSVLRLLLFLVLRFFIVLIFVALLLVLRFPVVVF